MASHNLAFALYISDLTAPLIYTFATTGCLLSLRHMRRLCVDCVLFTDKNAAPELRMAHQLNSSSDV